MNLPSKSAPCRAAIALSESRRTLAAALLPLLAVVLSSTPLPAQTITSAVPGLISYQSKVSNANGTLVGAGTPVNRLVVFRIWSHSSNSTVSDLVYAEQQTVTISEGEFSVLIGQGTAVGGTPLGYSEAAKGPPTVTVGSPGVFGGATRFLGVTIDDGNGSVANDPEISPRQQLVSSAYAFRAKYAEALGSNGVNSLTALDNGNVGIGTSAPNAALDVNGGVMLRGTLTNTSSRPTVGSGRLPAEIGAYGSGGSFNDDGFLRLSAGGGTNGTAKTFIDLSGFSTVPDMNANLTFGTAGSERMRITAGGLVGIGTSAPNATLDVNGGMMIKSALTNASGRPAVGNGRLAAEIGGYSSVGAASDDGFLRLSAGGGTTSTAKTFIDLSGYSSVADMNATVTFGTTGAERMRINSSGDVGIGTTTPRSKVEIAGSVFASGGYGNFSYPGVGVTLGGGGPSPNSASVAWGDNTGWKLNFGTNVSNVFTPRVTFVDSGKVGIGNSSPSATLLVESATTAAGENTATFRFGAAGGSTQSHIHYGTTGDIYWRSGATSGKVILQDLGGNVGIGTSNPFRAKLEVSAGPSLTMGPYYYVNGTTHGYFGSSTSAGVSIYAAQRVVCNELNALSDQRIKNIKGRSDGRADLATMMGVEVTDYVYRDVVEMGGAPYKKVIAQQVEKVFPQAVKQSTDTVPDIYTMAGSQDGWILLATDLNKGDRVKLITDTGSAVHEVLAVEPGRFRTTLHPKGEKVFVYGREVKDFRVVDYEAIAMLNVSATQELKREKDAEIAALRRELAALRTQNETFRRQVAAIEKFMQSSQTAMAKPAAVSRTNANGQE